MRRNIELNDVLCQFEHYLKHVLIDEIILHVHQEAQELAKKHLDAQRLEVGGPESQNDQHKNKS